MFKKSAFGFGPKRGKTSVVVLAIAAVMAFAGACTDDSPSTQSAPTLPESTPTSTVVEEPQDGSKEAFESDPSPEPPAVVWQGTFFDLMTLIPLTEGSRIFVQINDYVRAREAHNIDAPEENAGSEDLEQYMWELSTKAGLAGGPWLSGFTGLTGEYIAQLEQKYLGFGVGDVERSILTIPPRGFEAVSGRIDPEATESSLSRCTECEEPDIREHRGVEFYSWGEDFASDQDKVLQPPAFDNLGRGGRIAVLDSLVLRTVWTEGMRSLIDTYLGRRDSLADDPDLALAARQMDSLGVYSASLVGQVEALWSQALLSQEEQDQLRKARAANDERGMDEYRVLGAGVAKDTEGFLTILVFVYENEDIAGRNVQAFKEKWEKGNSIVSSRPWKEYFPQGEVWNDGRVLVARLRTEKPTIWLQMVTVRESLITWDK